jgi:hypothetical protein
VQAPRNFSIDTAKPAHADDVALPWRTAKVDPPRFRTDLLKTK